MSRPEDQWYHPDIGRDEAERLLLAGGPADGRFLVRDSNSAPGDLVLSVRCGAGVLHYQIRQHDEDAIYSIDEGALVHGLDALVELYRGEQQALAVRLGACCRGVAAPSALCRQGTANLLHRATASGDIKVVTALINSSYSHLHSKDQRGQTAVHMAAALGRREILRLLVTAGCTVNVRDVDGLTPLHYAARHNRPHVIRELVETSLANVQARVPGSDWVPLHEAAHSGAGDAVRALLSLRAPARPRDRQDRLPADLARVAGHRQCQQLLERHQPPVPRRMRSDFLHGQLARSDAEQRLQAGGLNDGDFLLRTSTRNPQTTVLSMVHWERVYHFEIRLLRSAGGELQHVYIDDGPYLDSLEHLVEHYSTLADGLMCRLSHPLPPSADEALRAITEQRLAVVGAPPSSQPPLPQPRLPRPGLIALSDLEFGAVIGNGEFGRVYQGRWREPRGQLVDVAVKTQRDAGCADTESDRDTLVREATCLRQLSHPCIVRFLGMVQHSTLMMVQELMPLGSLLAHLKSQPRAELLLTDLRCWCGQVADGMAYMAQRRIVHRDLAARNILLASSAQAKISDFGFSRVLPGSRDYYRVSSGGRWPVKWYAPESMNYGTFSSASDVWGYGVLVWEIYARGDSPYGEMPGVEAFLEVVERGERLPPPAADCPDGIYQLMLKCWAYAAVERPTFGQLHKFFSCGETDGEYRNVRDLAMPLPVSLTASDVPEAPAELEDSSLAADESAHQSPSSSDANRVNNNAVTSAEDQEAVEAALELYDSPRCHTLLRPSKRTAAAGDNVEDSNGNPDTSSPSRQRSAMANTPAQITDLDGPVSISTGTPPRSDSQLADEIFNQLDLYDSPRSHTIRQQQRPNTNGPSADP